VPARILFVTQEPPLKRDEVVSGNAVRAGQLCTALEAAGHTVVQLWPERDEAGVTAESNRTFRSRDGLQGLLMKHRPDVILVAYWELLGLLPADSAVPVVLDYVAPRTLEELYESPATVRASLRRLILNLRRCDLVLVGNEAQRALLLNPLLEAGFDLRQCDPVRIVPLGAEVAGPPATPAPDNGWIFVTGGVTWPWRNSEPYLSAIESIFARHTAGRARLVRFGGSYRWHDDGRLPAAGQAEEQPLESYRSFTEFLSDRAHVGVELAERNVEREFSQSFRSLEFLRHGLPLLCNRWLPVARSVEAYDAGWLIDEPASLDSLLEDILAAPEAWQRKSENARRLVAEVLNPQVTVRPLLDWLEQPARAARLPASIPAREEVPVLGIPPLGQRIRRQFDLAKRVLLGRLFAREDSRGVLFVTRGDLFPPDHGAAVRTVATARALARAGVPVGIVTDDRRHWYRVGERSIDRQALPFWTRLPTLPAPLAKLLHFSKDLPLRDGFLYLPLTDGSFFWRILAAAKVIGPCVLQAEFPAYAAPCIRAREALSCSVVLVQHNVEYERLRAQIPDLSDAQYENLKALEIDLCNRSDAVVCVSDNDRQKLGEDGVEPDLLHLVPHGVNLDSFDATPAVEARTRFGIPQGSPLLVYHGTFSYPPNREALRIFAEILLPGLEAKGLDCHLLAVGRDAPGSSPHPRVHLTGSVEQVGPWLRAADLAVVPLIEGGGTRMKIIDYFAAGLPVISTGKGIEGIPVVDGEQALVRDDWPAMIAAVSELTAKPERARAIGAAGRKLAEGLDWSEIARRYQALYATLETGR
jgi:glycosyltransferase involved in cell wall biosynthesis